MIIKNNKKVFKIYDGENSIQRIYKGTTKTFEYLPLGYKECKYLESAGPQYIDLNIKATENTKLELDCSVDTIEKGLTYRIFGARNSSNNKAFGAWKEGANSNTVIGQFDTIAGTVLQTKGLLADRISKIILSKDGFYVDNELLKTFEGYKNFTTSYNLLLFAINVGTGLNLSTQNLRIYTTKIWEDGELILNLVPCLDSNNVPCMYDIISKTTFYNAGTGDFSYKLKIIPDSYTQCKYLESTGAQYINLNIKATENTKLELDCSVDTIEKGVSYRIFGARNSSNNKAFVAGKQSSTNNTIFAQFDTIAPVNVKNIRPSVDTITKITLSKDGFYVDNELSRTFEGYNDFTTSDNILLFAINGGGTVSTTTQNLRIYYTKIWEDGELILNLIPCLDDNDVPCMYDTVSKTTLYNVGTGTFNYEVV